MHDRWQCFSTSRSIQDCGYFSLSATAIHTFSLKRRHNCTSTLWASQFAYFLSLTCHNALRFPHWAPPVPRNCLNHRPLDRDTTTTAPYTRLGSPLGSSTLTISVWHSNESQMMAFYVTLFVKRRERNQYKPDIFTGPSNDSYYKKYVRKYNFQKYHMGYILCAKI